VSTATSTRDFVRETLIRLIAGRPSRPAPLSFAGHFRQLTSRRYRWGYLGQVAAHAGGQRAAANLWRDGRLRSKEDIRYIWTFELQIIGSNGWAREDLHDLIELVRNGKLKVLIDRRYQLHEAGHANSRARKSGE
jgi:threonine dehydrogenase-like Zn-dependent dehydrogenase